MASVKQKIAPCLWFDTQAEDAARFYISVFKNSRITGISYYANAGREVHGRKPGSVMVVEFDLDGQSVTALNGGPLFKFNEAVSLQVFCETQDEIDYYWRALSDGGREGQCGWLKDKYGLSWQIVPAVLRELFDGADAAKKDRVMAAVMKMKKINLDALKRAATAAA